MRWSHIFTTPACAHKLILASIYIVVLPIYIYLLNANAVIYSNTMAHDLYIFIDGAHRIVNGQIPHLNFTSGLGAGNFYLTALLEPFANNLYQAFLWQNTIFIILFMVLTFYVSISRLTFSLSVLLFLYVTSLLAVPSNIGDDGRISTFAMFYNRFGWATLLLTFLLFIPGHEKVKRQYIYDVSSISFILVFCFYVKITYFLAVFMLLIVGLALFPAALRFRAIGVALASSATVLLIELLVPGFTFAYLGDVAKMRNANGGIEFDVIDSIYENIVAISFIFLAYLLVFSTPSLIPEGGVLKRFFLSLLFLLICIFIIENNYQYRGLPALFALLCAYVMVCISDSKAPNSIATERYIRAEHKISGLYVLAFLFSIPEFAERNGSLDRFYRYGKDPNLASYSFDIPAKMADHMIDEGSAALLTSMIQGREDLLQIRLKDYRNIFSEDRPRQEIYQSEYAYTIANGSALLSEVVTVYGEGAVLTMDFSNPFSYLLDLAPADGDYLWFHDDKNISYDSFPEASELFLNIAYIMEPRYAANKTTYTMLSDIYRSYIAKHYQVIAENGLWVIWKSNR
jgi:hypothetical protein